MADIIDFKPKIDDPGNPLIDAMMGYSAEAVIDALFATMDDRDLESIHRAIGSYLEWRRA